MRHTKHKVPSSGTRTTVPTTTAVPHPDTWRTSSDHNNSTFRTMGTLIGASEGGFDGAILGGMLGSMLDE